MPTDEVIVNQHEILANQKSILANQAKLDRVLANQATITANQETITPGGPASQGLGLRRVGPPGTEIILLPRSPPMTFGRTVLVGTLVWVTTISLLHHYLSRDERRGDRTFRVGFLPVT